MRVILQGQLSQLQAERDRLDTQATTAERDLATASSELEEARLSLKVKLEEQQNQFRAIEEEQYSEWEKRVRFQCCKKSICHQGLLLNSPNTQLALQSIVMLGCIAA